MRIKRLLAALAAAAVAVCSPAFAGDSGESTAGIAVTAKADAESGTDGLSVSQTKVRRGDDFDVLVTVPPVDVIADTAQIKVFFDTDAFKVVSWEPRINGRTVTSNYDNDLGFFAMAAGNVELDLSSGVTFYATLRTYKNVDVGDYTFRMAQPIINSYSDGYRWQPAERTATIRVANDLAFISGKVSAVGVSEGDKAKVTLTDRDGNTLSTSAELTYDRYTGGYTGTYSFSDAEIGVEYTMTTDIAGCKERVETVTASSNRLTVDQSLNILGDIDGDGERTALDATQILRYLVQDYSNNCIMSEDGVLNEYLKTVGHASEGGELDAWDATQILRDAAGLSSVFNNIN